MSFDNMTPEEVRQASRRAAWKWGSFVVLFLGIQVAIGVVAIILATGDESVAVVPDYYEKGLNWDDEVAIRNASDQLNWSHQLLVGEEPDPSGRRSIVLRMIDADRQPIQGAQAKIRYYHHARAAEVDEMDLQSLGGGNYQAILPMRRDGLWEFEIDLQLPDSGERYVSTQTVVLGTKGRKLQEGDL